MPPLIGEVTGIAKVDTFDYETHTVKVTIRPTEDHRNLIGLSVTIPVFSTSINGATEEARKILLNLGNALVETFSEKGSLE